MRILVAGVGNLLRGDDAFGVAVARAISESRRLPDAVSVFEAGIAGIALVQELMGGYDALIVADAADRGQSPGTVYLIEPEVPVPGAIDPAELHRSLVDAHYADPSKVLLLASALKVLPPKVFIVGCQPRRCDEFAEEMSPEVANAVHVAARRIEALIEDLMRAGAETGRDG